MSPLLASPPPPVPSAKARAPDRWALALYLLAQAGLVLLKLLPLTRVAAWPWATVTALLWVPWAVLLVLAVGGWGLHLLGRRRRG